LEDAKAAYLEVLKSDSCHQATLLNFGALLHETDYRRAAATVYRRCVELYPDLPTGHVHLARLLLDDDKAGEARVHYEKALALDPDNAEAHQGMASILQDLRDEEGARAHGLKGYAGRATLTLPYRGRKPPVTLLLLGSATGGNIPLRKAIPDRVFQTTLLAVEYFDPAQALPPHQIAWNALGEADGRAKALEMAAQLLKRDSAPLINPPALVAGTGRARNAARLAAVPGLRVPRTLRAERARLEAPDAPMFLAHEGLGFPLLLRAEGFHAGRHFAKIDAPGALAPALRAMPGDAFVAMEFLDARGADGKCRKYRVMMIDGRLHPLHAAVSSHWKIHYFSADMAENAAHRAEDEAFLNRMPEVLGPKALAAVEEVCRILGLDYAGMDFGVNTHGDVLFFEANATMVILPPEADARWDYRRAPVQRALDAVQAMLLSRVKAAS
jgi:hypothetical protein